MKPMNHQKATKQHIYATKYRGIKNQHWTVNYKCTYIPSGSFVRECTITF